VLVRAEAASVNPVDTYVREGNAEPAGGLPHAGGSDVAGIVESVGDDLAESVTGDRAFATGLGVFSPGTHTEEQAQYHGLRAVDTRRKLD